MVFRSLGSLWAVGPKPEWIGVESRDGRRPTPWTGRFLAPIIIKGQGGFTDQGFFMGGLITLCLNVVSGLSLAKAAETSLPVMELLKINLLLIGSGIGTAPSLRRRRPQAVGVFVRIMAHLGGRSAELVC